LQATGQTIIKRGFHASNSSIAQYGRDFPHRSPRPQSRPWPSPHRDAQDAYLGGHRAVKQTLTKIKTDGLAQTLDAVKSKLDQPIPLGYCNAGVVAAVGAGVDEFKIGDRVVSNGPHAELVTVGRNLVCKIPDGVSDSEASFVPLAAIGLQSVRLAEPTLGETFCVLGLGLVGLLTAQLLKANGCRVIGADFSKDRLTLAKSWGVDTIDLSEGQDPVATVMAMTGGRGADGVIIAASTKSNDPIEQAAQMSRKRGRIILVGVVGLELTRSDYYDKELSFQVSCSYGPGRGDPMYEERGQDYPLAFVRWTEQRNFEACLEEIRVGRMDLAPLMSKTIDISEAEEAYTLITKGSDSNLGVLLSYPEDRKEKFESRVSISGGVKTSKQLFLAAASPPLSKVRRPALKRRLRMSTP